MSENCPCCSTQVIKCPVLIRWHNFILEEMPCIRNHKALRIISVSTILATCVFFWPSVALNAWRSMQDKTSIKRRCEYLYNGISLRISDRPSNNLYAFKAVLGTMLEIVYLRPNSITGDCSQKTMPFYVTLNRTVISLIHLSLHRFHDWQCFINGMQFLKLKDSVPCSSTHIHSIYCSQVSHATCSTLTHFQFLIRFSVS